jgi:predicted RNase H-like nuclease (RuvC/YqgF family)
MEWFFDRKGKSIAHSAQRVVADMHIELDKQNKKIKELERTIFKFKNMCTESLERDISRLEARKKELISELAATDDAILAAQDRLRSTKEEVANMLLPHIQSQLTRSSSLDEQYIEETEMFHHIKSIGDVFFIIHLNASDDIFVYLPSENPSELVKVAKITDIKNPKQLYGLTSYEKVMVNLFIVFISL